MTWEGVLSAVIVYAIAGVIGYGIGVIVCECWSALKRRIAKR